MAKTPPIRLLLPALAFSGLCLAASPAAGQTIDELQKQDSRYVDWLKERQAAEVLEHYAKGVANGDEKTRLSLRIAVAATNIEAIRTKGVNAAAADQARIFLELRRATEELLTAQRERSEKFGDDDSALIWQTGLISDVVDNYLRLYRNNAVAVYEFGSPDADQAKAFEEYVPVAFQTAVRAAGSAEKIQKRMLADKRFIKTLQKSGLRHAIEDAQALAKYWQGATAYWMTLLPDTHPYFANLGKPGAVVVPGQKPVVADERKRLLAVAADALATSAAADGQALYACVLLAQGKEKDAAAKAKAIDLAQYADAAAAPIVARIIAAEAKVAAATGTLDEAVKELRAQAVANPAVTAELKEGHGLPYLFVCDAAYRLLMDASKKAKPPQDMELFNKAFLDPYADIFGDKPLENVDEASQKAIRGLRPILSQRWKTEFASTPPEKLPGFLILETLNIEFSDAFMPGGPWAELKKVVDEKGVPEPAKVKALGEKLRHIETGLVVALEKEKVNVVRAKLLNQLALTRFLGAQVGVCLAVDPKNTAVAEQDQSAHAAAMDWLKLADTAPESADAAQAIDYATALLHKWHELNMYPADYAAAGKVLFAKYPKTKAAVRELSYYADKVVMGQGKFDEALALLATMPKDDEFYFSAQQKALALRERIRRSAQESFEGKKGTPEAAAAEAKLNSASDAVIQAASALEDEAKAGGKSSATPGYRRASARFVRANAVVVRAGALAAKGSAAEGVALLDKYETEFAPETLIVAEDFQGKDAELENMRKYMAAQVEYAQIVRMRMLMDAGQGDQVKSRALELLGNGNPKSILVLKGLLRDIRLEVDRLTATIKGIKYEPLKVEMQGKRQKYGQAMLDLTKILRDKLLNSASKPEKEYLDLLQVQAMSASGDTAGAVKEVDALLAAEADMVKKDPKYPRSLNLILVASQTYFDHANGIIDPTSEERRKMLAKAYKNAKAITDNFFGRGAGPEGFPTEFYEALWTQLISLEAMPATGKVKAIRENIPTNVDTIREADPKGFGNLPWNERFIQLKDRITVENQNAK